MAKDFNDSSLPRKNSQVKLLKLIFKDDNIEFNRFENLKEDLNLLDNESSLFNEENSQNDTESM